MQRDLFLLKVCPPLDTTRVPNFQFWAVKSPAKNPTSLIPACFTCCQGINGVSSTHWVNSYTRWWEPSEMKISCPPHAKNFVERKSETRNLFMFPRLQSNNQNWNANLVTDIKLQGYRVIATISLKQHAAQAAKYGIFQLRSLIMIIWRRCLCS